MPLPSGLTDSQNGNRSMALIGVDAMIGKVEKAQHGSSRRSLLNEIDSMTDFSPRRPCSRTQDRAHACLGPAGDGYLPDFGTWHAVLRKVESLAIPRLHAAQIRLAS